MTADGTPPVDALYGFIPAKSGVSYGPTQRFDNCYEGPVSEQTSVDDHALWSPAKLHQYGLPTQAELGVSYDDWAKSVRAATYMNCSWHSIYQDGTITSGGSLTGTKSAHAQIGRANNASLITPSACPGQPYYCLDGTQTQCSGIGVWFGYVSDRVDCQGASCPALVATEGYWHIPSITLHSGGSSDLAFDNMMTWYGIGGMYTTATGCGQGDANPSLVQAGTRQLYQGSAAGPLYTLWMENVSSLTDCTPMYAVVNSNAGDLMYAVIGGGNGAGIYIQDQTTGTTDDYPFGPSGYDWPLPDQNTVECVSELPDTQSYYTPFRLSEFSALHFEACRGPRAGDHLEKGIGSIPNDLLIMMRYYQTDGSVYYCATSDQFDPYNATYGYMSYYQHYGNPIDYQC